MASRTAETEGGLKLTTILFVVFLVLKLIGKIGWSWWWVTSPLWIPWGIFAAVLILIGIVVGIAKFLSR